MINFINVAKHTQVIHLDPAEELSMGSFLRACEVAGKSDPSVEGNGFMTLTTGFMLAPLCCVIQGQFGNVVHVTIVPDSMLASPSAWSVKYFKSVVVSLP